MLLSVGADGNLPNKHLQTPMHVACMGEIPIEILEALLGAGCSPNVLDVEVQAGGLTWGEAFFFFSLSLYNSQPPSPHPSTPRRSCTHAAMVCRQRS